MDHTYVNTDDWLAVVYCAGLEAPRFEHGQDLSTVHATCLWGVHGIMRSGTREAVEEACKSFMETCEDPTCTRDPGAHIVVLPVPPGVNPKKPPAAILAAIRTEIEARPAPLKSLYTN